MNPLTKQLLKDLDKEYERQRMEKITVADVCCGVFCVGLGLLITVVVFSVPLP